MHGGGPSTRLDLSGDLRTAVYAVVSKIGFLACLTSLRRGYPTPPPFLPVIDQPSLYGIVENIPLDSRELARVPNLVIKNFQVPKTAPFFASSLFPLGRYNL